MLVLISPVVLGAEPKAGATGPAPFLANVTMVTPPSPVDPGFGVPAPPVDPGYGRPGWSPVDPGYGRPGWSPVDPGYGRPGIGAGLPGHDLPWAPARPGHDLPNAPALPGHDLPGTGGHPWLPGMIGGGHPSHPIYHPDKPTPPGEVPEEPPTIWPPIQPKPPEEPGKPPGEGIPPGWLLVIVVGHGYRWVHVGGGPKPSHPIAPPPEPAQPKR